MESQKLEKEITNSIKKLLEPQSKETKNSEGCVLDQKILQDVWNNLNNIKDVSKLQEIVTTFFKEPNLEEVEVTLRLIELLEYLYSKNSHSELLRALNHSNIVNFFKLTARAEDKKIKDKSLFCIYTITNKLKDRSEVESIRKLKKDLILSYNLVCTDNSESFYFKKHKEETQNSWKLSLLEEFLSDESYNSKNSSKKDESKEEKKISSFADDFDAIFKERHKQSEKKTTKSNDIQSQLTYPKPFSQDIISVSPPSKQGFSESNLTTDSKKLAIGDSLSKPLVEISNNVTKINEKVPKKKNIDNDFDFPTSSEEEIKSPDNQSEKVNLSNQKKLEANQSEEMEINLLTFEELLDYKTSKCDRKDCHCPGEVTSQKEFLNNIELFKCSFYHSHKDQRRCPVSHNDYLKSYYKHNKLCDVCMKNPNVHRNNRSRCTISHNWFEVYFHPKNYKLEKCNKTLCLADPERKKYCPLYHSEKEKEIWDKVLMKNLNYDRTKVEFTIETVFQRNDSNDDNSNPLNQKDSNQVTDNLSNLKQTSITGEGNNPVQIQPNHSNNQEKEIEAGTSNKKSNMQRDLNSDSPPLFRKNPKTQNLGESDNSSIPENNGKSTIEETFRYNDGQLINTVADKMFQPENLDATAKSPLSKQKNENIISPSKAGLDPKLKALLNDGADLELAKQNKYIVRGKKLMIDGDEAEENKFVEFKSFKGPSFEDHQWEVILKAIGGFLNADGGRIFIGVDDSGIVRGTQMSKKAYDDFKGKLISEILRNISPKIDDNYYKIDKLSVIDEGKVLTENNRYKSLLIEITIKKGVNAIYFAAKEINSIWYQICYQRFDASTRMLRGDQINDLIVARYNIGNHGHSKI